MGEKRKRLTRHQSKRIPWTSFVGPLTPPPDGPLYACATNRQLSSNFSFLLPTLLSFWLQNIIHCYNSYQLVEIGKTSIIMADFHLGSCVHWRIVSIRQFRSTFHVAPNFSTAVSNDIGVVGVELTTNIMRDHLPWVKEVITVLWPSAGTNMHFFCYLLHPFYVAWLAAPGYNNTNLLATITKAF